MRGRKLSIFIVTQDDPFYLPIFFKYLFGGMDRRVEVKNTFLLDPFDESLTALMGRMYALYGPINFVRRGVDFVIRKGSDTFGLGAYSVATVAEAHGIPVESVDTVNDPAFVRRIEAEDISVILSVSAPEIFGPSVLDTPRWGCLNVHTAKLPQYRGMLPTFWALYHEDEEIGVTVHTMEEEIDQGEIAAQSTFPVAPADTLDDIIKRGKQEGGRLAAQVLNTLAREELQLKPMEGEESYFSFPTAEERRELQERGRKLL